MGEHSQGDRNGGVRVKTLPTSLGPINRPQLNFPIVHCYQLLAKHQQREKVIPSNQNQPWLIGQMPMSKQSEEF
ncbi:hypothetical protein IQ218_07285 [Synechocystis salina LEGE 06099]|uniref:hypothetical protein n=1 Tax=Synechocystis salina TaxID=945780 RepID=UPI001881582E|nr:hypothetical protein [Synechocystis salina]MBE9203287.1 hypothetical protein [Synechocystis salina LEGE 06099]